MSICAIGDTHGKIIEFQNLIHRRTEPEDVIIQVGDMGAGFVPIPRFPDNTRWIRGNHDDPQVSREHPNYLGDYGYKPEWDLFYLAGAWSIDWKWRKQYNDIKQAEWDKHKTQSSKPAKKIWWEDEELSQEELDKAIKLYKETKPKIVVSHDCPSSITPYVLAKSHVVFNPSDPMYRPEYKEYEAQRYKDYPDYNRPEKLECIKTGTSQALQAMLDIWRPKWWVFGHFHVSKTIDTGSTLFKCCEELELFRIPE